MELWIRSQDKMKLFRGINFRGVIEQEGCSIIDNTDDYIIGTYKSIERALEILDEIQKLLEPKFVLHTEEIKKPITEYMSTIEQIKDIKELSACVYEMPEN